MRLKLINKRILVSNVIAFIFEPDEVMTWKAGQFLRYHLEDPNPDERRMDRFFSISSTPEEKNIMLTSKFTADEGSTFKRDLLKMKIGGYIQAMGPFGHFIVPDVFISEGKRLCFIAGGIGITPFRSIILDLENRGAPINITLLYANRNNDIVFKDELEAVASRNPNFKVHYFIDPERITEEAIKQNVPDLMGFIFYISGPEPMVQSFEKMLEGMGIAKENVKRDYFPGYSAI